MYGSTSSTPAQSPPACPRTWSVSPPVHALPGTTTPSARHSTSSPVSLCTARRHRGPLHAAPGVLGSPRTRRRTARDHLAGARHRGAVPSQAHLEPLTPRRARTRLSSGANIASDTSRGVRLCAGEGHDCRSRRAPGCFYRKTCVITAPSRRVLDGGAPEGYGATAGAAAHPLGSPCWPRLQGLAVERLSHRRCHTAPMNGFLAVAA